MRSSRRKPVGQTSWRAKLCTRVTAFAFICSAFLILAALTSPVARAARDGARPAAPIIHWDSSMIYAGQNNGDPWGPVGENTIVHGANFNPNVQLRLLVSPGDSNSNASICKQPVVTVVVANVTTDGTGGFTQNFPWPSTANKVNQGYSICSMLVSDNSLASSQDDGPFTVLASSPPVIAISATSVPAGGTVTVTGQNWVPPQPVSVDIAGCAACDPGSTFVTSASVTSAGLNSGSFSATISIPSTTKPGNYVVDALTKTGLEAFYTTGVKHLTITAVPTTPTPTPSPSPAAQPSPTPSPTVQATVVSSPTPAVTVTTSSVSAPVTTTNTSSGGTTGAVSSGSSKSGIVVALVGMAIAMFLIAGVILFALRRKRELDAPAAHNLPWSPGPYYAPPGQFMQSGHIDQNGMSNGYAQFSQPVTAPTYVLPVQEGQAVQQGSYPSQFVGEYNGQGQQVNGAQSFYAQPTEAYNPFPQQAPQGFQQQSPILPTCPNCGRPLVPNLPTCGVCGMPLEMMRR